MLVAAGAGNTQIGSLIAGTRADSAYRYYHIDWSGRHCASKWFASVSAGRVIGAVEFVIEERSDSVTNVGIICFDRAKGVTFAKDAVESIKFMARTHRKLSFFVVADSPEREHYRRIFLRYGGRSAGIKRAEVLLSDGRYHDIEMFEYVNPLYLGGAA
jgi:hypothetical protein